MIFRVVVDDDADEDQRAELVIELAPLLGLPFDTLADRLDALQPWIIDTADRELAQAIAERVGMAFQLETAAVPAIGEPSTRAAGFAAALDDLARRRVVENARRGLLRPFRPRPDPTPLPVVNSTAPPSVVPPVEGRTHEEGEGAKERGETVPSAPPTAPPRVDAPVQEPPPQEAEPALELELDLTHTAAQHRKKKSVEVRAESAPATPAPQSRGPAGRAAATSIWGKIEEIDPGRILTLVLGLGVAVGAWMYLSDEGPPPDVDAGDRELEKAMRQVVTIAEQAWKASRRFPPSANTRGPALFKCTTEDDPPVRPKKVRRDVTDWDNGAWMFVRFPPASSFLTWHFESGGEGRYAWFVARAVGDLDCDGTSTTYETLGYVRDDIVHHARREAVQP